jgi:hypothetical protein
MCFMYFSTTFLFAGAATMCVCVSKPTLLEVQTSKLKRNRYSLINTTFQYVCRRCPDVTAHARVQTSTRY